MRNYPPLSMPLPLAQPAAPTPSYCQCQDFTFNKFCKSLKNKQLPPPPLFPLDYDLLALLKGWMIASLMRGDWAKRPSLGAGPPKSQGPWGD